MHFVAVCHCIEIGLFANSVKSFVYRLRRMMVYSTENNKTRIRRVRPALEMSKIYCNMKTLGFTLASKPMRSSAPLAVQQFHIRHI